jgi:hypothetical protein
MAEDRKSRTFTKKGPGGKTLTREVSTVSDEVAANFDGFFEQAGTKSASSSTSSSSSKP